MDRKSTTQMLSDLVVKRLTSKNFYWSAEVNFDKNTSSERRIDFVGFKPYTPWYVVEPTSVELGAFACYEVKSGMADYTSGHGLSFYGDENYLVTTQDFAMELLRSQDVKLPKNLTAILCPDKTGQKLYTRYNVAGECPHRLRPASEMLWAIVQSHGEARAGRYPV